jgi:hypothetical protein
MPEYRYTVTEHDPERPWIVRGSSHEEVALPDDSSFFEWAQEHWPAPVERAARPMAAHA